METNHPINIPSDQRIETLITALDTLWKQHAPVDKLLALTGSIVYELQQRQSQSSPVTPSKITFIRPPFVPSDYSNFAIEDAEITGSRPKPVPVATVLQTPAPAPVAEKVTVVAKDSQPEKEIVKQSANAIIAEEKLPHTTAPIPPAPTTVPEKKTETPAPVHEAKPTVTEAAPVVTPKPIATTEVKADKEEKTDSAPGLWNSIPLDEIPTFSHQTNDAVKDINQLEAEINTTIGNTINDTLKRTTADVASHNQQKPIRDLKKAIGINDRFQYINELFRGDEDMYERSLKTINAFHIYPEARFWMDRELKLKMGWDDKNPVVRQFEKLVERRFL